MHTRREMDTSDTSVCVVRISDLYDRGVRLSPCWEDRRACQHRGAASAAPVRPGSLFQCQPAKMQAAPRKQEVIDELTTRIEVCPRAWARAVCGCIEAPFLRRALCLTGCDFLCCHGRTCRSASAAAAHALHLTVVPRLQRTDVKGSGFIQFPPQRPFSERLEQQPPTLSVCIFELTVTVPVFAATCADALLPCRAASSLRTQLSVGARASLHLWRILKRIASVWCAAAPGQPGAVPAQWTRFCAAAPGGARRARRRSAPTAQRIRIRAAAPACSAVSGPAAVRKQSVSPTAARQQPAAAAQLPGPASGHERL